MGTAVSSAPSLKVLDEKGEPFAGLPVTFTVTGGGGSVTVGSTTTSTTGVASVGSWTLGTTAGTNTVIGTPEGLSAVTFTATGTAGSPTTITVNAGESQAGIVGADVAAPPSVLLEDSYHNPVPQVSVTFEVTSGGGTVSGGTATTNSSGIAAVGSWTMGTLPGTNTLQATYTGLTPISFSATAEADVPAVVNLLSGDGQAATVGTQLPVLPTVEVTDQYANVLEGVGVVFAVASGGGTISGESQTTNSSGTATLGSWTLGTTAGTQTLSATVGELTPATITATAVADVPTTLQGATEATQTGTVGLDVDELPTVLVQDQFGNGVPGTTVTFTETAAPSPPEAEGEEGARRVVTGGTVTTDANGEASPTSWVLGTTAGLYKLTAAVQGLASPVVFQATADPDVASIILIHSGDNQSALFGTALAAPARVKVTDQYGNPIEGVQVVFAVASGEGSITGETATTGADGIATVGSWTMGPAPATNTLTATAGQIGSVTFTATGTGGPPLNLSVEAVHLNQANQARLGTIGSIAGRAALLRVLVKASSANTETPDVRIRLYNGATLLREVTVSAPRSGVPTTANLNVLTDTWNVVINAGEVVAGLRVEVMVDPSGSITDFNLADNRFPQGGGTASLDVQTIPDLNIVFIPIIATTNNTTGSINAGNEASFLTAVRQLLAVSTINTVHHAAFTTAHDLSIRQGWGDLLTDIQALRTAEGATDQYYHGIVGDMSPIGSGGVAYVPFSNASGFRSALSYDRQPWAAGTVAHETGHNLGLRHAPCGDPEFLDASYPYANAQIGPPGYDVTTGSFMNTTNLRDFMSYCKPEWISDYNYNKLVQWRRTDPLASPPRSSSAAKGGSRTNGLLVWGRIDSEGVTLNPAFALEAPPSLPEADGPNQLRAVSADGRELFRFSFLGAQLADSPDPNERHFAYFVPLSAADVREVARIELATPRGAAAQGSRSTDQAVRVGGVSLEPEVRLARRAGGFVRVQWNDTLYPMAIVRDPATGQILSFARGGDVEVDASGLNMESLQILVSDGAKTRVVRPEIR